MKPCMKKLDSPSHRMIAKIMGTLKLHRSLLERILNNTGVYRSQHQILMYIADHPKASQKDIAKMHNVSTATIAVSLKKLEKGGYIKRIVAQEDNRYNEICITDQGNLVVEKSIEYFKTVEQQMFAGFLPEDFEQFGKYLDLMHSNMEGFVLQTERKVKE